MKCTFEKTFEGRGVSKGFACNSSSACFSLCKPLLPFNVTFKHFSGGGITCLLTAKVLNLSWSKARVVSESLCFGSSLFNFKLHGSSWAVMAGTGDSPHALVVVNSFFVCGFPGSLPLSLPSQGGLSRNTLSSVVSTQDGRKNSLFTYF